MNGLQSIPRTYQGEQLSYISPQEAQLLRQQGGGVAPDGGQLLGPGGIPSFGPSDIAQRAAADMAFFQQMLPEYTSVQHLNQSKGGSYAQAGQPGFQGAIMAERSRMDKQAQTPEPEPEPEFDVEAYSAERKALLDETYDRSKQRLAAMYANLGFTPPAMYGEDTDGNPLFTGSTNISDQQGWAGYQGNQSPTGQIVNQALGAFPAQQLAPQQNLQARVNQQAQEIRAQQPQAEPVQAAQGGLINRYDLGGIVNSMMLQASRSRDNIPSNAIS